MAGAKARAGAGAGAGEGEGRVRVRVRGVGAGGGGHRGGAREVDELLDLVDGALQPLLDEHSGGHPLRLGRVSKSAS